VIVGHVTEDGVPLISVHIAGTDWAAIVDTGLNGDVELPNALRGQLSDQPVGRLRSTLAGGQVIEEDAFLVELPFDGKTVHTVCSYVQGSQVLIGTSLLRDYQLESSLPAKSCD
jgi:hypothetical protein